MKAPLTQGLPGIQWDPEEPESQCPKEALGAHNGPQWATMSYNGPESAWVAKQAPKQGHHLKNRWNLYANKDLYSG